VGSGDSPIHRKNIIVFLVLLLSSIYFLALQFLLVYFSKIAMLEQDLEPKVQNFYR
jgi:hypothetical protein